MSPYNEASFYSNHMCSPIPKKRVTCGKGLSSMIFNIMQVIYLRLSWFLNFFHPSCPLTPVVSKASSGVMEILGVYGYENLTDMLKVFTLHYSLEHVLWNIYFSSIPFASTRGQEHTTMLNFARWVFFPIVQENTKYWSWQDPVFWTYNSWFLVQDPELLPFIITPICIW